MASSTHRIRIHASPEAVFKAISTEDGLRSWYTSKIDGSLSKGQTAAFGFPNGESFEWKTTDLQANKMIARDCVAGPGVAKGTKVKWEVEGHGDDAIVKLVHHGWPDDHEALATCNTFVGHFNGELA